MKLNSIQEIIDDIRNGKMVILIDDEDRENEGDVILAADFVTPAAINFMATEARGLICLALEAQQIDRLGLPLMVGDERNHSPNKTAFTVSIEAAKGVSTGISAADRAHTIRVASNPRASHHDVIMPGHIFPIRAQRGGVIQRAGHTEASVDLARMAGLNPAAVICEVMKPDGSMARLPDLVDFASKHNIKIGTIEDLIRYRLEMETLVEEIAKSNIQNKHGMFTVRVFKNLLDNSQSVVLQKGEPKPNQPTVVRMHVENILADVFKSEHHQPTISLDAALEFLGKSDCGILVYLRKEGLNSLLPLDLNNNTSSGDSRALKMDPREHGIGAQILRHLGVTKIHLLASGSVSKVVGIKGFGLEIEKVVTPENIEAVASDDQQDAFLSAFLKH
ncbi:MAG: 3,4-dihydroxy-2-butanone-4-phosphate synthase [Bdellovibrionaceae bacterium]|nr:3,4-dihydroxy-2-butanone-4-phosphate synthase [Pseudobdellovibrionaceae bacterium]